MHWHVNAMYLANKMTYRVYLYWTFQEAMERRDKAEAIRIDQAHRSYAWTVDGCQDLNCLVREMAL